MTATTVDSRPRRRSRRRALVAHWSLARREGRRRWLVHLSQVALLIGLIAFWQYASGHLIREFWISKPTKVFAVLRDWYHTGYLTPHLEATLTEMGLGLLLGGLVGIFCGLALGTMPKLAHTVHPIVAALYSLPTLALAPLMIIWFGIGLEMRVIFVALVVYFVVFWTTYAGARDTDGELLQVMKLMGAGRGEQLRKVVLPGSMPSVFVGLELALPSALRGAVVAELVASNRGLGYVIVYNGGHFNNTGMIAGIVVVMALAAVMTLALRILRTHNLRWMNLHEH